MQSRGNGASGRVILVRHGESEGNRDRTFTQNPEVPLTTRGHAQASAAARCIIQRFAPRQVVASPFVRAWQTAEVIAETLGLGIQAEFDLREQSFGVFAGQPYDALLNDAAYHDGPRWRWRPPGGESLTDVFERAVPVFDRIARDTAGTDVVVVSHGGVMLALCAYVSGSWDHVTVTPNAGIVLIEHGDGKYAAPVAVAGEPAV